MPIVITLLVGLVAGALAQLAMPSKDPGGLAITIILGMAGAFIAGMLGHSLGWYQVGEGPGLLASVVGAVSLLAIYRLVARRRAPAWATTAR